MTRVLLLCGGVSAEHDVSLASARSVLAAAPEHYNVTPIVIAKTGRVHTAEESAAILANQPILDASTIVPLNARMTNVELLVELALSHDVVFPILHGPFGEDGKIQGFLNMLGVPFVGSGVLGSSLNMDKITMKTMFSAHSLPQVDWVGVTEHAFRADEATILEKCQTLDYPMFVKPANLGSSVGISKVRNRDELLSGLNDAFLHDNRVIVEAGIDGVRELEIGVLGNADPAVSIVGEIRYDTEFYDYDSKYASSNTELIAPANDVPDDIITKIEQIALTAFHATETRGIARVDFFYKSDTNELWLNEINTMPGFTQGSMYPVLFQKSGISYSDLIERLVNHALES